MNVQESILNEKIDPLLTNDTLGVISSRATGRTETVVKTEVLLGGCWNRVIAVELRGDRPDLVLKISPNPQDAGIRREYAVLEVFTQLSEMPIPTPYVLDESGEFVPGTILVMERIPGAVLHQASGYLNALHWRQIIEQLSEIICSLHTSTNTTFGGVELDDEKRVSRWADFWLPRFDRVMGEVVGSGQVDRRFLDDIASLRPRFSEILDTVTTSVLTHYDIWSGNVMIDVVDGKPEISGFVDVQGHWADYARELSFMEMFGMADQTVYDAYRGCHGFDDGFDTRKNLYNLKMHLKHITMYPDQTYYRDGARSCYDTVRRALS